MQDTNLTTLVSLFHTEQHASNAISELQAAGISKQSIEAIGGISSNPATEQWLAGLKSLNLPAEDLRILSDGLSSGGTVIVVRAERTLASKAQSIFEHQNAEKIDERELQTGRTAGVANSGNQELAGKAHAGDEAIPVIEEQLVVGKRNVERGGMRVFTRMVETPVEEQIILREEHATFERRAVNRPIPKADIDALRDQSIEIREMNEEAVVGKTAHVVEEVHIGKETTEKTQTIKDTVRKTEVEIDEAATDNTNRTRTNSAGSTKV